MAGSVSVRRRRSRGAFRLGYNLASMTVHNPEMNQVSETITPALLEFLRTSSAAALRSYRDAKQAEASNLVRELESLMALLVDATAAVELATLFIELPTRRVPLPASPLSGVFGEVPRREGERFSRRGGPRTGGAYTGLARTRG